MPSTNFEGAMRAISHAENANQRQTENLVVEIGDAKRRWRPAKRALQREGSDVRNGGKSVAAPPLLSESQNTEGVKS